MGRDLDGVGEVEWTLQVEQAELCASQDSDESRVGEGEEGEVANEERTAQGLLRKLLWDPALELGDVDVLGPHFFLGSVDVADLAALWQH